MKIGDIVIFSRPRNKGKAMGKVGGIDGKNILLLNIVDSDLNKLSGSLGSGNITISDNMIIDVIRL